MSDPEVLFGDGAAKNKNVRRKSHFTTNYLLPKFTLHR